MCAVLIILVCAAPSVCLSQRMECLGSALWQGGFNELHLSGSFCFCANDYGLLILEVSNSNLPEVISNYYLPEKSEGVFISANYAYLACGAGGLNIIDVSDPAGPVFAGRCDSIAEARAVYVSDSYAYVANGYSGLEVVEVTDPSSPALVGHMDTPGITRGVQVLDDFAYLADYYGGMQVVDVSEPADPNLVTSYETIGNAYDLFVLGDYAYVAEGDSGLEIIDISEPAEPSFAGRFQTTDLLVSSYVQGDLAYLVLSTGGMQTLNVSNPGSPRVVGHFATFPNSITDVFVSGSLAYLCQLYPQEVLVVDVEDPENPRLRGEYSVPGRTLDVCGKDSILFCANGATGLSVVEVSDPDFPREIARVTAGDTAYALSVWGENLYVADGAGGLKVVGISDPENPTLLGEASTPASALEVLVVNDLACVVCRYEGLFLFDVSEPSFPTLRGVYHRPAEIWEVAIQDSFAYLTTGMGGLEVVDISDPSSPAFAGNLNTGSYTLSLLLDGDYAYVGDANIYGVHIIDISEPRNPVEIGTYPRYEYIEGLYKFNRYLFCTTKFARRILILDVGDPISPVKVAESVTPGAPRELCGEGYSLFLASEYMCCLLDFTPILDLEIWALGAPVALPPQGGYVYYSLQITNTSDSLVDAEVWRKILLPDGEERYAGVVKLLFHPGQMRSRDSVQTFVPGGAPGGEYRFTAYVGTSPSVITDFSSFTFAKLDTIAVTDNLTLGGQHGGMEPTALPLSYSLSQNSPNPFNLSTTISYTLREPGPIRLEVYNLRGEKVATLVSGHQEAGEKSVTWQADHLSSGIYFYRLVSGELLGKRRALLLK